MIYLTLPYVAKTCDNMRELNRRSEDRLLFTQLLATHRSDGRFDRKTKQKVVAGGCCYSVSATAHRSDPRLDPCRKPRRSPPEEKARPIRNQTNGRAMGTFRHLLGSFWISSPVFVSCVLDRSGGSPVSTPPSACWACACFLWRKSSSIRWSLPRRRLPPPSCRQHKWSFGSR